LSTRVGRRIFVNACHLEFFESRRLELLHVVVAKVAPDRQVFASLFSGSLSDFADKYAAHMIEKGVAELAVDPRIRYGGHQLFVGTPAQGALMPASCGTGRSFTCV
jgi:hypothetical protein